MFLDLDPARLRFGRLAAMVAIQLLSWIAPLCFGIGAFVWLYRFVPPERFELPAPVGKHRAFVENAGFVDAAYLLQACDWPWTFSRPFRVANLAAWPERYYSSTSHWTRDGSAIVFATRLTVDSASEIQAGYDFKNRCGWDGLSSPSRPAEMPRWLERRGGLGPDLGFQEWKGGEVDPVKDSPRWLWAVAFSVLAGSRWLIVRLVKNRFDYPENTLLGPE